MRLVVLESPYAASSQPASPFAASARETNVRYARACLADCLRRGEAPIAPHLLYTQPGVLDDTVPAERAQGIAAGLAWAAHADVSVVYVDLGISRGMEQGIANARAAGRPVEERSLGPDWDREGSR